MGYDIKKEPEGSLVSQKIAIYMAPKRLSETGELENAKAIISRLSLYQTLDLTGNDRRKGGGQ